MFRTCCPANNDTAHGTHTLKTTTQKRPRHRPLFDAQQTQNAARTMMMTCDDAPSRHLRPRSCPMSPQTKHARSAIPPVFSASADAHAGTFHAPGVLCHVALEPRWFLEVLSTYVASRIGVTTIVQVGGQATTSRRCVSVLFATTFARDARMSL